MVHKPLKWYFLKKYIKNFFKKEKIHFFFKMFFYTVKIVQMIFKKDKSSEKNVVGVM